MRNKIALKIGGVGNINKSLSIELNDITVICGKNNTGKTYLTYSIYGFLRYFNERNYTLEKLREKFNQVLKDKKSIIYNDDIIDSISQAVENYKNSLGKTLSIRNQFINNPEFAIENLKDIFDGGCRFSYNGRIGKNQNITYTKKSNEDFLLINLNDIDLGSTDKGHNEAYILAIENHLKYIINRTFLSSIPLAQISSVERTGIAIFQAELENNNELDLFSDDHNEYSFKDNYPQAVKDNVKTVKQQIALFEESPLASEAPYIIDYFNSIIGGEYRVIEGKNVVYYPNDNKHYLYLNESSSSIKALLDLGMYLKHSATKGQIFIIDEPEMNLHPENQRKIARVLAMLANYGIKIVITTHSDFITRELSLLVMLKGRSDLLNNDEIMKRQQYQDQHFLDVNSINVYSMKNENNSTYILKEDIDSQHGFSVPSFDSSIDEIYTIYSHL